MINRDASYFKGLAVFHTISQWICTICTCINIFIYPSINSFVQFSSQLWYNFLCFLCLLMLLHIMQIHDVICTEMIYMVETKDEYAWLVTAESIIRWYRRWIFCWCRRCGGLIDFACKFYGAALQVILNLI